jgi:hypothetical protein
MLRVGADMVSGFWILDSGFWIGELPLRFVFWRRILFRAAARNPKSRIQNPKFD